MVAYSKLKMNNCTTIRFELNEKENVSE